MEFNSKTATAENNRTASFYSMQRTTNEEDQEEAIPATNENAEDQTPKPAESMLQKLFNRKEFKRVFARHVSVLDESDPEDYEMEHYHEAKQRLDQGFFDISYHFTLLMNDEIKASGGARTEQDVVLEILDDLRRLRIEFKIHNPDGTLKSLIELKDIFLRNFQKFVDIYQITADITTVPEVMTDEVMPVDRYPRIRLPRSIRHWFPELYPETMLNGQSLEHLPSLAKGQTLQELLEKWNSARSSKRGDKKGA
ncbi:titin-like [Drosophila madeirensis]|uniref:Titin-like n=1 Tax=Drosophila madeirensis TaxID=30013 RepID=A0AAU9FU02_DROMD